MDFPILSTLIFLPLVSSFFIFLSRGQKNNNSAIYISLFSSLATFFLSLFVWYSMDYTSADFQFLEEQSWINDFIKFGRRPQRQCGLIAAFWFSRINYLFVKLLLFHNFSYYLDVVYPY